MNTQSDNIMDYEYNTDLDWRPLTAKEEEVLTKLYLRYRKTIAWFFYIWCGMGVFVISLGTITTIIDVVKGNAPVSNLITIPLAIIFAGGGFIAFPLWILNSVTMREVKAIRNKTAFMCETRIISKRESVYYKDHKKKYRYKFTVNLPYTLQATELEGSKELYYNIHEGENVLVFAPIVGTPAYNKVLPIDFTEIVDEKYNYI